VEKEFYTAIDDKDYCKEFKVKKPLSIQASKTDTKITAMLNVDEKVALIGGDGGNWYMIENSQGVRGWLETEKDKIKSVNLRADEVFTYWRD